MLLYAPAMAAPLTDTQISDARDRIVAIAGRQAAERGLDRVSMHSIARELGWSATALYRYFDNKDAILAAARTSALDRLSDRLEAVTSGPGDVWDRSRLVGDVYVAFALENPDAYRLIFTFAQPATSLYPDVSRALARARENMTHYVEQLVEEGGVDADPDLLAHVFWAGLHGVISLHLAGKIGEDTPSLDAIRKEMMRRIVRGSDRTL